MLIKYWTTLGEVALQNPNLSELNKFKVLDQLFLLGYEVDVETSCLQRIVSHNYYRDWEKLARRHNSFAKKMVNGG